MLSLVIYSLVIYAVVAEDPLDTRIIGGVNAKPHEFPHQCSLQWNFNDKGRTATRHFCGASILNPSWTLTAAHCRLSFSKNGFVQVAAGEHDLSTRDSITQVRRAVSFIVHPLYSGGNRGFGPNDVAIIKVDKPFHFNSYVRPVALPDPLFLGLSGDVVLSGWGSTSKTSNHKFPTILQKAHLPLVPVSTCKQFLSQTLVTSTNICAGVLDGSRGACIADSGGPLIQYKNKQAVQVGIVSWGLIPCGGKNAPTVFANVASFVDWIKKMTKS